MMQKVFDFLKMLRTLDKNAEAATKELLPGLEITHQECSFDPASPWYDSEFKYLGEVFTLRYLVTDKGINNCCILELIHDGKCIDLPCEADSDIKKFIIDNFLYKYQECIEIALGEIFFWTGTESTQSADSFTVKGTVGNDTVGRFNLEIHVRPENETVHFDIYDGGTLATTCSTDIPLGADGRQLYTAVKEAVDKLMTDKPIIPREYARLAVEKIFDFCSGDDERDTLCNRMGNQFVKKYLPQGSLNATGHYIDNEDHGARVMVFEVIDCGVPYTIKFKQYADKTVTLSSSVIANRHNCIGYAVSSFDNFATFLSDVVAGVSPRTKQFYLDAYSKRMDECAKIAKQEGEEDTFAVFNDIAQPDEVIGYYLETYGDEAVERMKENFCIDSGYKEATALDHAIYGMLCEVAKAETPKPTEYCPFCSGSKVQADFSESYMMRGDAPNIMVVYAPSGVALAKFTINSCPVCKKDLSK